ncbi:MAG: hypothetical protein U0175_22075 [Caldilineaceae bacterium]
MLNLDPKVVQAVLDDYRAAPIHEKLRATLSYLEVITLRPEQATVADVETVRQAGVSDKAIEEALYVCFCFNIMVRLADSFNFPLPSEYGRGFAGRFLNYLGYSSSTVPG